MSSKGMWLYEILTGKHKMFYTRWRNFNHPEKYFLYNNIE